MFPIKGRYVIWIFDNEEPAELIGIAGVLPRGTLAVGTTAWQTVKVKVKGGKATGYIGRGKAWGVKLADIELRDLDKMPQTGVGLVSLGGVTVFRNPAIKFYK
jgi:hypothetical protein